MTEFMGMVYGEYDAKVGLLVNSQLYLSSHLTLSGSLGGKERTARPQALFLVARHCIRA